MKKLTNKGFGLKEFMTGMLFIIVLGLLIFKVFVDNKEKNFTTVKVTANNFAKEVTIFKDKDKHYRIGAVYYLHQLIADGMAPIKDPIERQVFCDPYTSFVTVVSDGYHVNLTCGNFLITGRQGDPYKVYDITPWQENKENTNEETVFYNYKVGSSVVLDKNVTKEEFIQKFNKKEGRYVRSIDEIKRLNKYQILTKEMYRTKTFSRDV